MERLKNAFQIQFREHNHPERKQFTAVFRLLWNFCRRRPMMGSSTTDEWDVMDSISDIYFSIRQRTPSVIFQSTLEEIHPYEKTIENSFSSLHTTYNLLRFVKSPTTIVVKRRILMFRFNVLHDSTRLIQFIEIISISYCFHNRHQRRHEFINTEYKHASWVQVWGFSRLDFHITHHSPPRVAYRHRFSLLSSAYIEVVEKS